MPLGCRWATYYGLLAMGYLLWPTYVGLSHWLPAVLVATYYGCTSPTYLLWLQVAYLDCYAMRFVKPHAAASAGTVATSDLPPLPLQYSLGAEKARLEWSIKPN